MPMIKPAHAAQTVHRSTPPPMTVDRPIERHDDRASDGRDSDRDSHDAATMGSSYTETASRMRPTAVRQQAHPARESEIDARNTQRSQAEDYAWRRPTNLDAPPPNPGMRQKWIRADFRTDHDNLNWSQRTREGWTPRDPATVPEDVMGYFPVRDHARQSVIKVGGLVLCEMPEAKVANRTRAIRAINHQQNLSISADTDKASREGSRMGAPPIVRDEQVTSEIGRRPATLAD